MRRLPEEIYKSIENEKIDAIIAEDMKVKVNRESVLDYLDNALEIYHEKKTEPGKMARDEANMWQTAALAKVQFAARFNLITSTEKKIYYRAIDLEYLIGEKE